ncbi:hypothetical protein AGDE_15207 [Angomonas deanei]|uniref:Uncharacterized protein n=1 Tax=Angomonas deanei TaxID=59799 RepID=A0A7G2C9Y5_9TRYP|nr:hypothetical protein AGDE_15207 [Angomonas deanei]CAD2215794.1 hypothetical protein, conserved [Angomonas deanei]|eukprot:EPY19524.1 hypothetical protein AGDE_15207 [Angomonas deanei]
MRTVDLIEPTSAVYEAILSSLYFLAQEGGEPTIGIVGEERVLHRAQIGDAAGYYFGAALSQHRANQAVAAGEADMRPVTASLWTTFFVVAATCQVAPKLMDLWFDEFLQFFDEEKQLQSRTVKKEPPPLEEPEVGDMDVSLHQQDLLGKEAQEAEMEMSAPAALPYDAVHAILSWSAASRDIQRALRFFKEFNTRGLFLSGEGPSLPPGSLTAKSNDKQVQLLQLRLLVKLMSTGKSVKMDGGLKALITNDVKRLIDLSVIQAASWGTVNDLLSGLSMPSAMKLLKLCSSSRPEGDGSVPFAMWASLLRRCAHEHHLDQAESLFEFIRRRFQLTSLQKRELVEIAIRMYVTLPTPDFASAMHIFTEHVVHTPEGEPPVKADTTLYTLLIKAADSPNAAMMVFLEGCAEGVELQYETFEALLGAERDVSRLSRKLPHDYTSSALDSLLSIPSDVDAHQRREEALRLRNKPLFNSTGDSS